MLIFGLLLFVMLVVVHEFGHFIAAKRSGVEVEEFGVGFPPKLLGEVGRRATDVSLNDPVSPDSSRLLGDTLAQDPVPPIEDEMIHRADLDELASALGDLDGKEREVVRLRFGLEDDEPRTLQQPLRPGQVAR